MRNPRFWTLGLALIAVLAFSGCTKKAEVATSETSSDSLVASNPTERQSGDITPQTGYQEPPTTQAPPPVATPKPRATKPAPRHTETPRPAEAPGIMMAAGP
jgi:hypothetical protein